MRTGQRNLYAERISRAVQELEELANRGEAPTLAALASAAGMSEFHFHRIFRLMTGESFGGAMTRIRLGHGLSGLAPGVDLREATGRSGYATSQAFSRALKDQLGATPGELRSDPEKRVNAASALSRSQPTPDAPLPAMNIEIVSFDPLRLLAVRNIGDYAELNQGFGRLFEGICAQMSPESILGLYGVPHDDPRFAAAEACRFDCAFDVGDAAAPGGEIAELMLAGGRYARLHHMGDYDLIHRAMDALYNWALFEQEIVGDTPLFIHYLDDPDEVAVEDQRAWVYLPLSVGE